MRELPAEWIDPTTATFLLALDEDEEAELTASIEAEGVRESLLVAQVEGVHRLIDGHRRYRIARKLGVTFPVRFRTFPSMADAVREMIRHQHGRRNWCKAAKIATYYYFCKDWMAKNGALFRSAADSPESGESPNSSRRHTAQLPAVLAQVTGESATTCERVAAVLEHGDPPTMEAMLHDRMSIYAASQLAGKRQRADAARKRTKKKASRSKSKAKGREKRTAYNEFFATERFNRDADRAKAAVDDLIETLRGHGRPPPREHEHIQDTWLALTEAVDRLQGIMTDIFKPESGADVEDDEPQEAEQEDEDEADELGDDEDEDDGIA